MVTGAGGVLCSAVARELAARGARVALVGRTAAKLDAVAANIHASGGAAFAIGADVTDRESLEHALERIQKELGRCSLLVNGAGGNRNDAVPTLNEFDPAELGGAPAEGVRGFFNLECGRLMDVIQLNTIGTILPCQIFGRAMAEDKRGSIVNFASMNSYRPLSRNLAYGMAKAGVVNFTQWLASYLAPAGVRVNAVAPGFFLNDRNRKILTTDGGGLTARGDNVMAHTPMKQFGEAGDIVGCVCWLLNDAEARFVTGVTIPVDGGFLACSGV